MVIVSTVLILPLMQVPYQSGWATSSHVANVNTSPGLCLPVPSSVACCAALLPYKIDIVRCMSLAEDVITSCPSASNISRFDEGSFAGRLHAVERAITAINKSLVFIGYVFRLIKLTIFKRNVKNTVVFTGPQFMAVNTVVLKQGGFSNRLKR